MTCSEESVLFRRTTFVDCYFRKRCSQALPIPYANSNIGLSANSNCAFYLVWRRLLSDRAKQPVAIGIGSFHASLKGNSQDVVIHTSEFGFLWNVQDSRVRFLCCLGAEIIIEIYVLSVRPCSFLSVSFNFFEHVSAISAAFPPAFCTHAFLFPLVGRSLLRGCTDAVCKGGGTSLSHPHKTY